MNENQRTLWETLQRARNVLQRLRLPFRLMYGTALGATREGGIIPHDDDVDVGVDLRDMVDVLGQDRDRRDAAMNAAFQKGGFVPRYGYSAPYIYAPADYAYDDATPILYQYINTATKRSFDVYSLMPIEGDAGGGATQVWECSGGGERTGKGHPFPDSKPVQVEMYGVTFQSMPLSWIELQYGKDWRTPKRGSRGRGPEFLPACRVPPMSLFNRKHRGAVTYATRCGDYDGIMNIGIGTDASISILIIVLIVLGVLVLSFVARRAVAPKRT